MISTHDSRYRAIFSPCLAMSVWFPYAFFNAILSDTCKAPTHVASIKHSPSCTSRWDHCWVKATWICRVDKVHKKEITTRGHTQPCAVGTGSYPIGTCQGWGVLASMTSLLSIWKTRDCIAIDCIAPHEAGVSACCQVNGTTCKLLKIH